MRNSENSLNVEIRSLKQDFLSGLGAKSDDELIANLEKSFLGDSYQANVINIFKRFYQEKIEDSRLVEVDKFEEMTLRLPQAQFLYFQMIKIWRFFQFMPKVSRQQNQT